MPRVTTTPATASKLRHDGAARRTNGATAKSRARRTEGTASADAVAKTAKTAEAARKARAKVVDVPAPKRAEAGHVDDDDALRALVAGVHAAPHDILGPHPAGKGKTVVRALFPAGSEVTLVVTTPERINRVGLPVPAETKRVAMQDDGHGVLAATVSVPVGNYHFEVKAPAGGRVKRVEDPYRFAPTVSEQDLYLFKEGTLEDAAHLLGAHEKTVDGKKGFNFVVWAPNARGVSVVGDWNDWDPSQQPMRKLGGAVFELFVPGVKAGEKYMFSVAKSTGGRELKADPAARTAELRPGTASITVGKSKHAWNDGDFMKARAASDPLKQPLSTYEVHLPSWKRNDDGSFMGYRELADELVKHLEKEKFNAVELVGLAEHPYDGSWGYQVTGYFAPTSRHGGPDDFKYLVDKLHEHGIRVIFDWVPAHYPKDAHGLDTFDGTHLFDHEDPRLGEHLDWGTRIFNYGRKEVKSFLVGSLMHMLDEYHLDGVRVDAVASMLYRDYSRSEWIPNEHGGKENLEAIAFLQDVNTRVGKRFPGVLKIAEESTAFPGVTKSAAEGGLGFDLKWNMGWMHDTLEYMKTPTEWRGQNLDQLTNTFLWAYSEKFVAALSHDEVVHLKRSLLEKMPGDEWQKLANLRLLFGFMFGYPGQKLLFMGSELAQQTEWNFNSQLPWSREREAAAKGMEKLLADLNKLYESEPALSEKQFDPAGNETFLVDKEHAVVGTVRKGNDAKNDLVFLHNLTEKPRQMRIGLDSPGQWRELLNTDAGIYGGSGVGNAGAVTAEAVPHGGKPFSAVVTLPPLGTLVLKRA